MHLMSSDKQKSANRENARKSTGPKSKEGKAKSRRNSLKHGLAGEGKVLKRPDDQKVQKAITQWREQLQPEGVLEDSLVERAALASVRLEMCLKHDLAAVARRKRRAKKRWESRR